MPAEMMPEKRPPRSRGADILYLVIGLATIAAFVLIVVLDKHAYLPAVIFGLVVGAAVAIVAAVSLVRREVRAHRSRGK
jgi:hypothetical protein